MMTFRYPGGVEGSYGYRSDGKKGASRKWESYGPTFHKKGDIVGCGLINNSCFFTLNGEFLGVAFRGIHRGLCPTVNIGGGGSTVEGNFGQKMFRFDLDLESVRQLCK